MALLGGSRGFALGFAVGFGAGFIVRDFVDHPREKLTPTIKMAMRAGIKVMEVSREWLGHFGELIQDSYAEVKEDLKEASEEAHKEPKKNKKITSKNKNKVKKTGVTPDNIIHLDEQRQP